MLLLFEKLERTTTTMKKRSFGGIWVRFFTTKVQDEDYFSPCPPCLEKKRQNQQESLSFLPLKSEGCPSDGMNIDNETVRKILRRFGQDEVAAGRDRGLASA